MLKIVLIRLKLQAEKIIAEEQAGFTAGRSRKCWMDNIKEWTSLPMPKLLTRASCKKDRKRISAESSLMFPGDQFGQGTVLNNRIGSYQDEQHCLKSHFQTNKQTNKQTQTNKQQNKKNHCTVKKQTKSLLI